MGKKSEKPTQDDPLPPHLRNKNKLDAAVLQSPLPSAPTSEGVATLMIVFGTVFTTVALPGVAFLGLTAVVIGTILPQIWPGNDPNKVWLSVAKSVNGAIDRALEINAFDLAAARAKMMKEKCIELRSSTQHWLDSGKKDGAGFVRSQYAALTLSYMPDMNLLAPALYRSALLPLYVNAGLNYLSLLHDLYPLADDLQLASRDTFSGKAHVLMRIRDDMAKLVNQATESYNAGLQEIKNKAPSSQGGVTWSNFSSYRTYSTVAALDYLALYPYLDPELYAAPTALRNLNRRLLSFLDTNDRQDAKFPISNIASFEAKVNVLHPLYKLRKLAFTNGFYQQVIPELPGDIVIFDGLTRIDNDVVTTDGYEQKISLPSTSIPGTFTGSWRQELADFQSIPFFRARYWLATDARFRPNTTIKIFIFYRFINATEKQGHLKQVWLNQKAYPDFRFADLDVSFPPAPNPGQEFPDRSFFGNILEEMRIFNFHKDGAGAALLTTWHRVEIDDSMLPQSNHLLTDPKRIPIEQFHAIRAANAIKKQGLGIIAGPGFTGGDMVAIGFDQYIEFLLTNNQTNWFAGLYAIRLWFYRSNFQQIIRFLLTPAGNFVSSAITETIPASGNMDIQRPHYTDLISYTTSGTVLISGNMPAVTIRLENRTALAPALILDRFEFIFQAPASDPLIST